MSTGKKKKNIHNSSNNKNLQMNQIFPINP